MDGYRRSASYTHAPSFSLSVFLVLVLVLVLSLTGRSLPLLRAQGPKGELSRTLHPLVSISQEGNVVSIQRLKETKTANAIHGLERALVNNMVIGVTNGFEKTLSMIGVGYRAAVNGKTLTLSLGYSHPVEMAIPEGIKVEVVKNTTIIVSGHDKEQVGQFSSDVRSKREPEPYKGKGVRYVDEYIRRKAGKSAAK